MFPQRRNDPGFGSGPPRYPGTFLLAFREALAELSWQPRHWRGEVVECTDANGSEQLVGLENLYRRVRGSERAGWPVAIAAFLRTALGTMTDETVPDDLASVAEQLFVRLGPPLRRTPGDPRAWAQTLEGTGLVLNLVIDFPERMVYVTEPMVAASDRTGEEWLNKAVANLRGARQRPFRSGDECPGLLVYNVADAYDSSRVLLLDELLPEHREQGFFVSIPSRDQLLVLPVSRQGLAFIHQLKVLAQRNFRNAPYPISPEVFWLHLGQWRVFGIERQGEHVVLEPPKEFFEILEELTPDETEETEGPGE